MCGFFFTEESHEPSEEVLTLIKARGPDSSHKGIFGTGRFHFFRLAISGPPSVTLPEERGRFQLLLNGEIYNFQQLSDTYLGGSHKDDGDTAVLCALISKLGFEEALKLCDGMFAILAFDFEKQQYWLARDRMGQKPLFFHFDLGQLTVSSSGLSIGRYLGKRARLSSSKRLLVFGEAQSATNAIFNNVYPVDPGEIVKIRTTGSNIEFEKRLYLDIEQITKASRDRSKLVARDSKSLQIVLENSVLSCLEHGGECGVLFSAGLDSSIVATLALKANPALKLFFANTNEECLKHAELFARKLNCDLDIIDPDIDEMIGRFENLAYAFDGPFKMDSLIFDQIFAKARIQGVTGLLSGDGADELFGGYSTFRAICNSKTHLGILLAKIKRILDQYFDFSGSNPTRRDVYNHFPLSDAVDSEILQLLIDKPGSHWATDIAIPSLQGKSKDRMLIYKLTECAIGLPRFTMRSDRTSGVNGIESRSPFLNMEVIEAGLQTSTRHKLFLSKQNQKYELKKLAKNIGVPNQIISRRKLGTPIFGAETVLKSVMRQFEEHDFQKLSTVLGLNHSTLKANLAYPTDNTIPLIANCLAWMYVARDFDLQ